jgi:hypothetical protein
MSKLSIQGGKAKLNFGRGGASYTAIAGAYTSAYLRNPALRKLFDANVAELDQRVVSCAP